MNWFYVAANKQTGPVNETEFENLVRSGIIDQNTQVWQEGMADWQRYGDLAAAAPVLTAAPPNPATGGSGIVCSECGQAFASDEVIRYGNRWVCAGCKPVFVQKLKEGVVQTANLEYAGFWTRFAAVFVDGILLWFVNFLVSLAVLAPLRKAALAHEGGGPFIAAQGILLLVQLAIGITYEVWFIGKYGATPGKMACKVKVVTPEGEPISYGRAFGRYFAKLLSGLILAIGYLMAAFDPEKRALHDRICNTRVIKTR